MNADATATAASTSANEIVMIKSVPLPEGTPIIRGYDFNKAPAPFFFCFRNPFYFKTVQINRVPDTPVVNKISTTIHCRSNSWEI